MSYSDRFVDKPCEMCGKKFSALVYDVARGWGRFCSRKCSTANALKHRKPGTSKKRLNAIAREIYIQRNGLPTCNYCGAIPADVHHMNEDRTDNSPENLMALCRSCHTKYHNHVSPKRKKAA